MKIELKVKENQISGNIVTLAASDLIKAYKYYSIECIKEYLQENKDWSDEKIDFVAKRAYYIFDDIERGEDEAYAIDEAEKEWEKNLNE